MVKACSGMNYSRFDNIQLHNAGVISICHWGAQKYIDIYIYVSFHFVFVYSILWFWVSFCIIYGYIYIYNSMIANII